MLDVNDLILGNSLAKIAMNVDVGHLPLGQRRNIRTSRCFEHNIKASGNNPRDGFLGYSVVETWDFSQFAGPCLKAFVL